MAPPDKRNQPLAPLRLRNVGANPTRDIPWIGSHTGFFGILEAAAEPTIAAAIHPTATKATVGIAPPANRTGGQRPREPKQADRTVDPGESKGSLRLPSFLQIYVPKCMLHSSKHVRVVLLRTTNKSYLPRSYSRQDHATSCKVTSGTFDEVHPNSQVYFPSDDSFARSLPTRSCRQNLLGWRRVSRIINEDRRSSEALRPLKVDTTSLGHSQGIGSTHSELPSSNHATIPPA